MASARGFLRFYEGKWGFGCFIQNEMASAEDFPRTREEKHQSLLYFHLSPY